MKTSVYLLFAIVFVFASCSSNNYFIPEAAFDTSKQIVLTDYSQLNNWAAHPEKEDTADCIPESESLSDQSAMQADVFFIHPTTLTGYKGETYWNAKVNNPTINQRTDDSTILFQASIFNSAGKVYAPRYQQAHVPFYFGLSQSGHDAR